jgi:hypothetical protein
MNKQFKVLFDLVDHRGETASGDAVVIPYAQLNEFAKLIVQGCADQAKDVVSLVSTYADAEYAAERIKKHFGVE